MLAHYLPDDWRQFQELFSTQGSFWLKEFLCVGALLFSVFTLFTKKSIACRFGQHNWEMLRINGPRSAGLGHLSSLAGTLSRCKRCQHVFDDLGGALVTESDGRETIRNLERYRLEVQEDFRVQLEEAGWRRDPVPTPSILGAVAASKKKKKKPVKPKKEKPRPSDRFDKILVEDEDPIPPVVVAVEPKSPKAASKRETPADTSTPPDPSTPEDSAP